jgi:hypothetical protein
MKQPLLPQERLFFFRHPALRPALSSAILPTGPFWRKKCAFCIENEKKSLYIMPCVIFF